MGVFDGEGHFELSDLHVELVEGFEAQVGVDDLGRGELELQAVVDLGREVAPELHAGALDAECRGVVLPFVVELDVSRDVGQLRADLFGGRLPAFERRHLGREAVDGRGERIAPLCGGLCRRKEAGGCGQCEK